MDVFLVPVATELYELYTEHVDEPEEKAEPPRNWLLRWFHGLKRQWAEMLAEAERERRHGAATDQRGGMLNRFKRRTMRWVAESIAEQRLLWNLRRAAAATLHHPDDVTADHALFVMRQQLNRDFEKHRFWLAIDSLLMVGSGVLILIPGPNIIGYYFAFRVVGHFFSVRGARKGLAGVHWSFEASPPLTDLRHALALDPAARLAEAEAIGSRLRLDHLATFFQRTATP